MDDDNVLDFYKLKDFKSETVEEQALLIIDLAYSAMRDVAYQGDESLARMAIAEHIFGIDAAERLEDISKGDDTARMSADNIRATFENERIKWNFLNAQR